VCLRPATNLDESELGPLLPVSPEELIIRAALGTPGRPRIEVGLAEPRFARAQGHRTPSDQLALRRALGGVSYPANRERVVAEAGPWLTGQEQLQQQLQGLPDLVYGGELEVLRRLRTPAADSRDGTTEPTPPSTGAGNEEGSSANR